MSKQDNTKNLTSINSLCSVIEFCGNDAIDFLNNLLISDLSSFLSNHFYYSALCNPKGRIISSFFILIKDSEHILLYCPKNMEAQLLQFFNLRKFRLKISITSANHPSELPLTQDENNFYTILTTHSSTDFYLSLFESNLPWIDAHSTEKFIPQHVNLDQHEDVMSFTKGCYPGQEIIARLKYLGKIKKRMKLIESDSKTDIEQKQLVSPIIKLAHARFRAQVLS